MQDKTNAMRMLDAKKIAYNIYRYGDGKTAMQGTEVASLVGIDPRKVFKTLVTAGASRAHYVFMIPVGDELDLKKAACAVREKLVAMIPQKELLPLTGYVHGGCSPIGMKKPFRTVIDASAEGLDSVVFSGGRIGIQIELSYSDLVKATGAQAADVVR